jgi:hypothetical protein
MRTPSSFLLVLTTAAALGATVAACGGGVSPGDPGRGPGADGGATLDGSKPPPIGRKDGGPPNKRDAGADASPYVDPPCPNPPPPRNDFECDVGKQTGCDPGEGCYPYVRYPSGYCQPEEYGAICAPAGSGTQGETCASALECAGGFICVITGAGTSCARYCELGKVGACPEGLVCEPLDVSGMGVCN